MDCFSGENADPKDLQAVDGFNRVLDEIITQLGERRYEVVSRRILDLMHALLDSISSAVSLDLEDLEKKKRRAQSKNYRHLESKLQRLRKKSGGMLGSL